MACKCDECGNSGPRGATGHSGLAVAVAALNRRMRARYYVTLACSHCGRRWARHRLRSSLFEWLPIVGSEDSAPVDDYSRTKR
jgi:hypothetical protein